jgi:hypothetical protein
VYLVFLVGSLVVLGALLEGRRLARWFEMARLVLFGAVPALCGLWLDGSELLPVLRWICAVVVVVSLMMLLRVWRNHPATQKDEIFEAAGDAGHS